MFNIAKYAEILEKCMVTLNKRQQSEEVIIETDKKGPFKLSINDQVITFKDRDGNVHGSGILSIMRDMDELRVYRINNNTFEPIRLRDLLIEKVHGELTEESILDIEKTCFQGM